MLYFVKTGIKLVILDFREMAEVSLKHHFKSRLLVSATSAQC